MADSHSSARSWPLHPMGCGWTFAAWFSSWLVDAELTNQIAVSPSFQLAVSLAVGFLVFGAIQKIAIRLSAGFQLMAVRIFVNRDSALEAIMNTTNVRSIKIELPEGHPHLKHFSDTLFWLAFCYMVLFYLVAFCPGPLGTAIGNTLNASLFDAGINLHLHAHENCVYFWLL